MLSPRPCTEYYSTSYTPKGIQSFTARQFPTSASLIESCSQSLIVTLDCYPLGRSVQYRGFHFSLGGHAAIPGAGGAVLGSVGAAGAAGVPQSPARSTDPRRAAACPRGSPDHPSDTANNPSLS